MKYLFVLLITIPLITGCKKKLGQFNIDYDSEVVIPSTFGQFIPFSLYTPEINTNSEFEFESNNTKKKFVESIYLEVLQLDIVSPQNETFSFLNDVEIYISSQNVTERKVAYLNDIPSNVGKTIVCNLMNTDLQEYVKEDKFTLRIATTTDETIPQDVTVNVYTNFRVKAKLLK